jgi:hypothetical protein
VTPLCKVLTEGNTPSLPRFIGNWTGFFNPSAGLISRMQFFLRWEFRRLSIAARFPGVRRLRMRGLGCQPALLSHMAGIYGTSLAYMFCEETRPLRPQTISD